MPHSAPKSWMAARMLDQRGIGAIASCRRFLSRTSMSKRLAHRRRVQRNAERTFGSPTVLINPPVNCLRVSSVEVVIELVSRK